MLFPPHTPHTPLRRYLSAIDEAELTNTFALQYVRHVVSAYHNFTDRVAGSLSFQHLAADHAPTLQWAAATVSSRSFQVTKPRDPHHPLSGKPFLAPGADLLDHDAHARVGWRLGSAGLQEHAGHSHSHTGEAFTIHAHDAYHVAGAPVYNHYQVRATSVAG